MARAGELLKCAIYKEIGNVEMTNRAVAHVKAVGFIIPPLGFIVYSFR